MNYFKPISISLSPNVEKDDVKLALNLIIRPWLWRFGKRPLLHSAEPKSDCIAKLEEEFKNYLGVKYAVSFNSGRSAFYAILQSLHSHSPIYGRKVLLQAFTCNAAINPVLWAKMKPVYVDCDKNTFNIDVNDLKNKISPSLIRANKGFTDLSNRVLVVQHTFGLPVNMNEVLKICKENNLILIEDCAHSLGAEFKGQKLGTFGEAAFFSFSRDKVISSVYGGMAVTNDDKLGKKLEKLQKEFGVPGNWWVFQQILHPIFLHYIILPIYNFLDLGKIFLVFSQWINILSKAVHWKEKRGLRPDYFPRAMPNGLAIMASNQFQKLNKFYAHRKKLFEYYAENLKNTSFLLPQELEGAKQSYLRFTVKHPKAHDIIYEAWHKENILLGDWYTTVIAPCDTKLDKMHYKAGMCKNAEWLAKRTLNLPTHINISIKDVERIVKFLKKY